MDAQKDMVAAVARGSAAYGVQDSALFHLQGSSRFSFPGFLTWAWGYHAWEKCPAVGDLGSSSERENIKETTNSHSVFAQNIPCLPSLKPPESPLQESFRYFTPCLSEELCHFCLSS